jgi:translocation and assembly module TamA
MRLRLVPVAAIAALVALPPAPVRGAAELVAPGASSDLARALRAASLTLAGEAEGRRDAQDVFAAARQDYARLLGALYAAGHYSGVISIRLDGREAADIAPLNAPARIDRVEIRVEPGPVFVFGRTEIGPRAPGTNLPEGFRTGAGALSGEIRGAVDATLDAWRDAGHAKVEVGRQTITADHGAARLDADIVIAPGPLVRFGEIAFSGQERMRAELLRAIAGFPSGAVYSPAELRRVAERLRRTGVFRSATLTEAETLGPGDTLDVAVALVEEAPRRIGFGAEIASLEGVTLTGFWLHRNLWGGAERLRIEAEIAQIGAQSSGTDYSLGLTFERPATFGPDIALGIAARLSHVEDRDQTTDEVDVGASLTRIFSETLTGSIGLRYRWEEVRDSLGTRGFQTLAAPVAVTWDRRDNAFDATRGTFLGAEVSPYLGLGNTSSGLRATLDGRAFQPVGDRIVLAGRIQAGAVLADGIDRTPRGFVFYSGGGGTVRGQPYQALGVTVLPGQRTGGMRFLGASAEVRARITRSIGAVAFFDVGSIGATAFFDAAGGYHAGAGIGLRYATPVGPIRLDVAAPAGGDTGQGVQLYIGIGQAF